MKETSLCLAAVDVLGGIIYFICKIRNLYEVPSNFFLALKTLIPVYISVLVPLGCDNRWLKLKREEIYSLTVLEARSLKSVVQQGWFFLQAWERVVPWISLDSNYQPSLIVLAWLVDTALQSLTPLSNGLLCIILFLIFIYYKWNRWIFFNNKRYNSQRR